MLKINVDEKHIEMEIVGDMTTICAQFGQALNALNERLEANDPAAGHAFKVTFTKGFMDGICFDEDREHMEHYLAEGDSMCKKKQEKKSEFVNTLESLIDMLKSKRDELNKVKEQLDRMAEEDEDEAE